MRLGGIVLVGGRGRRMGQPKADLSFRGQSLLGRVVRTIAAECSPVIVVAAAHQALPTLTATVEVVRDESADLGPLEGLRAGLAHLDGRCDAAFVVAVDLPLLTAAFVRGVAQRLDAATLADAVIPRTADGAHPLAAAYRVGVHIEAARCIARGERALTALLDRIRVTWLEGEELAAVDSTGHALFNVNTPEDLRRAEELDRG
jgi:molybdenum cofactor guanylyltransferase